MRRIIQITLLACLVCLCLLNVVVLRFIYVRYGKDSERVKDLEDRLQTMEHKVDLNNRWGTRTISTEIVSSGINATNFGRSTLHLDPHTNGPQRFELTVLKSDGRPVG